MYYPIVEHKLKNGYRLEIADYPSLIIETEESEKLHDLAIKALIKAMKLQIKQRKKITLPSLPKKDSSYLEIPITVWAKILLINEMYDQRQRKIDIAKKMGMNSQDMTRLFDLTFPTKIDTVVNALKALGRQVNFSIE